MHTNDIAILATRRLPPDVEQRLQRDYAARLNAGDELYDTETFLRLADAVAGIVACHTDRLDAALIARLPATVKVIANVSTGVDHVDLEAARERGIVVTNTPGVLADATAELTMLLVLAAARRAGEAERLVRAGRWTSWSPTFMLGTQVTGKRLGIVGMGGVGEATARCARGFGMTVHYHNRHRLPPDREQGAVYHADLASLLPVSDFLVLHCPATPATHRLLNAERIARLPDGAIVVNAARGSVVDEAALIDALKSGKLAAAGLDVYDNEPNINRALTELENVVLLPHIGSATIETRNAMGMLALDNLAAALAGREPPNRVA